MGEPPSRPDVERLLAEASWVRGLAARLLGEGEAEDLVQDVWIAALESGGAVYQRRGPGGLRAWIVAVLRNLARRRRHRGAARRRHEELAARAAPAGGPGDEIERVETHRLLAQELLEMEEPYRSAVVLRFLDGLRCDAIARRQGVSEAAARQRVSRGVARLRARLDRRLGGGGGVLSALLPVAGRRTPWLRGGLGPGGGIVGAKGIAVGVGLVGIAAVGLVALSSRGGRAEVPPTRVVESGPPAGGTAGADEAPTGEAVARLASAPTGGLHAPSTPRRAVTPAGDPSSRGTTAEPGAPGAAARGGTSGAASSEAPELPPLPRIHGRLLDPEGLPVEGRGRVDAGLLAEESGELVVVQAESGAGGTFALGSLPTGHLRWMEGMGEGFVRTRRELDVSIGPASDEELDLVLEGGSVVEGVVLDAKTDEPLADAFVWTDDFFWDEGDLGPTATTDVRGRFRLEGVAVERQVTEEGVAIATMRVYARTATHAGKPETTVVPWSADGRYEIVLRIEPSSCTVAGVVRSPEDLEPAGGVFLLAVDANRKLTSATTDAEGRFRLEGLPPGPLGIFVWRGALEGRQTVARDLELAPGASEELELLLVGSSVSRLGGHLLDRSQVGLAGLQVQCDLLYRQGPLTVGSLGTWVAETDGDGRYVFSGLPPGRYALKPPHAVAEVATPQEREVVLDADGIVEDQDFVVGGSATFAGTVECGSGSLDGLVVRLVDATSGAEVERVTPDETGRFLFKPVLAGVYAVQVLAGDEVRLDLPVGPAGDADLPLFVP